MNSFHWSHPLLELGFHSSQRSNMITAIAYWICYSASCTGSASRARLAAACRPAAGIGTGASCPSAKAQTTTGSSAFAVSTIAVIVAGGTSCTAAPLVICYFSGHGQPL